MITPDDPRLDKRFTFQQHHDAYRARRIWLWRELGTMLPDLYGDGDDFELPEDYHEARYWDELAAKAKVEAAGYAETQRLIELADQRHW